MFYSGVSCSTHHFPLCHSPRYGVIAVCVMIFYWVVIPDLAGQALEGPGREKARGRDAAPAQDDGDNDSNNGDRASETSPLLR